MLQYFPTNIKKLDLNNQVYDLDMEVLITDDYENYIICSTCIYWLFFLHNYFIDLYAYYIWLPWFINVLFIMEWNAPIACLIKYTVLAIPKITRNAQLTRWWMKFWCKIWLTSFGFLRSWQQRCWGCLTRPWTSSLDPQRRPWTWSPSTGTPKSREECYQVS